MKYIYLLMMTLLVGAAGCAAGERPLDRTPEGMLKATGAGAVTFGDTLAEAEKKMGEKARGVGGDARCGYVEFDSLPRLRFTVMAGIVTRADAEVGVRNSLGVNLGDTTESVVSLYPKVRLLKVPDSFGDTMLIFDDPGGNNAIVLEAAGNKIIGIRAGLNSAVGSTKGCP
jgi:hypothetical protein